VSREKKGSCKSWETILVRAFEGDGTSCFGGWGNEKGGETISAQGGYWGIEGKKRCVSRTKEELKVVPYKKRKEKFCPRSSNGRRKEKIGGKRVELVSGNRRTFAVKEGRVGKTLVDAKGSLSAGKRIPCWRFGNGEAEHVLRSQTKH